VAAADETTAVPVRLAYEAHAPEAYKALAHLDHAVTKELDGVDFDPRLRELVRVRASQLNGCAYCVDMHSKDARAAGETEQRLYALTVWRDTPFFTERERAALAFTEAVTLMNVDHVPDEAYEAVAEHYDEDEVAALVSLIVMINAWNAIGVSTHTWVPGSYEP
jgi:AhpD family alkylhydroperoxidase